MVQILLAGGTIAAASGLLGSFSLLRRMALVGDALSHVALPGIALGLLLHFNILLGSLAFLVAGTVGIWYVEHRTKLPIDTVVGVFFALSLAVGALLIPEEEILEALFGDIISLTTFDFFGALGLSLVIIFSLLYFSRQFILTLISTDLSRSVGYKPHQLEFLFLLLFALTVAAGIKFIGATLMGALIIIPAAASRNLTTSLAYYILLSVLIGVAGSVAAILISFFYAQPAGPVFILLVGAVFLVSIFFRRK